MRRLLVVSMALGFAACMSAKAAETPPPGGPGGPGGPPQGAMAFPDHFTNLKVFPKDVSKEDLAHAMRGMSRSLGVHCDFCHVTKPTKDWAADTPKKDAARAMMKMVAGLNHDYFTWPKAPQATCYMCHHGEEKPELFPPPEPRMGQGGPPNPPPGK